MVILVMMKPVGFLIPHGQLNPSHILFLDAQILIQKTIIQMLTLMMEGCVQSFLSVLTNCISETVECSGKYDLPTNNDCPLYGQSVLLQGTVVDFYDITPNNGPYSDSH